MSTSFWLALPTDAVVKERFAETNITFWESLHFFVYFSKFTEPFHVNKSSSLCWLNVCPSNAMSQAEKLFVCIEMKTVTQETTSTAALNQ